VVRLQAPPCEYYFAAFEELDLSYAQAYEFVSRFNTAAAEVVLSAGGVAVTDPKWITREATLAEIGRLP
jgi:hypothetical protein